MERMKITETININNLDKETYDKIMKEFDLSDDEVNMIARMEDGHLILLKNVYPSLVISPSNNKNNGERTEVFQCKGFENEKIDNLAEGILASWQKYMEGRIK